MTSFKELRAQLSATNDTPTKSEYTTNDDISENTMTTRDLREMSDRSSRLLFSSGANGDINHGRKNEHIEMPPPPSEISSDVADDREEHLGNNIDPFVPQHQGQQYGYEQAEDAFYYSSGDGPQQVDGMTSSQDRCTDDDATKTVHEMHYALLYLMSNPEELQNVIAQQKQAGGSNGGGYKSWADEEMQGVEHGENQNYPNGTNSDGPLLPYVVFAPDAEVVLPQAHTASQLFGVEQVDGIELEAAAGIPALCQLFLRWLALMPGGDHCNIIDPPGLTVMRIAGGRYRVTAAHRVVWTWLNHFNPETFSSFRVRHLEPREPGDPPQLPVAFGDLVTMTIVDVFETDRDGKLLSYCPTFDNRSVQRTNPASEKVSKMKQRITVATKSPAAVRVNRAASSAAMGFARLAGKVAGSVKDKVEVELHKRNMQKAISNTSIKQREDSAAFERAQQAAEISSLKFKNTDSLKSASLKSDLCYSDGSLSTSDR
mmetsp:Transcript_5157/g.5850  ORF Transcript_5157/g.5850 Transcript_5157/m.5850 type:complete len:486 (+) Transcript_5157:66-1523(+)